MKGKAIISVPVKDIIHHTVQERNDRSTFIRLKTLPCLGKFSVKISSGISNKHRHQQFFQSRFHIYITKILLAELPKIFQKIIFPHFFQKFIVCKIPVCQHHPDNFFKRAGPGSADGTEKTNQDIFLIKILYFKLIKSLSSIFMFEKLNMFFNHRLILLLYTQIQQQQRCTICKETPGVQQCVLQMVLAYIRFRKWSINQIISGGIHPFQKILCIKLIILFQIVDSGIFQLYILHIFCKFSIIVIPENQLPSISGKFHIETIYNLF